MKQLESLEARRLFAGNIVDDFGTGNTGTEVVQISNSYQPVQSDTIVDRFGRLVLSGLYPAHHEISVTRLGIDGRTDFTFGASSGVATLPLSTSVTNSNYGDFAIATDGGGRVLLLVGNTLTRLTNRGRLDTTFGTNGTLTLPILKTAAI